jgi:hypothetical protein
MIKRCYEELTDKHVVFVKNIDDYNLWLNVRYYKQKQQQCP